MASQRAGQPDATDPAGFERHALDDRHGFFTGRLPEPLRSDGPRFDELWSLHPAEYHEIMIHGRPVKTPRWQQAFGADYHYTGRVNAGLPVPAILRPLWDWCRVAIDGRLNGLLLNWYEPGLGHYIGAHRDSTVNMLEGAPIVTVSLGGTRAFRLRPWKGKGFRDFEAADGAVFVMPYDTNLAWTHEVPGRKGDRGRRISVTLRAFTAGAAAG